MFQFPAVVKMFGSCSSISCARSYLTPAVHVTGARQNN